MRVRPFILAVVVLCACLGERPRAGTPARRVAVDPEVVNFSRRGDQLILAGRIYRGNALATDTASFAWHAVDSTVAAVTLDGVLTARGDGVTRIWGVSGTDSAFAVVVVETPPAPVMVTVAPSQLRFSAFTAGARLAVTSSDTLARDSIPVCRSDDPRVAVVESLTVRARGNGSTRVRCSLAGVETATGVPVTVRQRIVRVRVTSDLPFALRVGRDSLNLTLARVDSLRQPVARGVAQFVSLDTGVVRVDQTGTVVAAALGTARVVGSVEGLADTAVIRVVEVAAPPTVNVSPRRGGGAAGAATRRPGVRSATRAGAPRASTAQLGARDVQGRDSVFQAQGVTSTMRPPQWAPRAIIALAERRGDLGGGTNVVLERSTGVIGGVEVEATPVPRLRFQMKGLFGKLTAKGQGETGSVYEAQADVGVAVFPWLWFQVGGGRRTFRQAAPVTLAHWTNLRTGGEARFGLGKGVMQGFVRASWPFVVDVRPRTERPSFAFVAEAGVDGRTGIFTGGLHYALERYDFPVPIAGNRRREQFGTIRVRIGLEFGR